MNGMELSQIKYIRNNINLENSNLKGKLDQQIVILIGIKLYLTYYNQILPTLHQFKIKACSMETNYKFMQVKTFYAARSVLGIGKLGYGGSVLGSSQFSLLPQLPQ